MAFSSGVMRYFYPRPPRGRRRENIQCEAKLLAISIHALREEGDVSPPFLGCSRFLFLSTPSARRATTRIPPGSGAATNFYPRPLRGGRPYPVRTCFAGIMISIHALREEGDDVLPVWCRLWGLFLSTPSARRATFCGGSGGSGWPISIHALREEGDPLQSPPCALLSNFYPRPPRGGRRVPRTRRPQPVHFYPRPPRGGATSDSPASWQSCCISIHALREEGDLLEVSQWAM